MIKKTSKENPNYIVSAYKDNVAFIKGPRVEQFAPSRQDIPDYFTLEDFDSVISLKAETHNFPTTVEPFNGAATGGGGGPGGQASGRHLADRAVPHPDGGAVRIRPVPPGARLPQVPGAEDDFPRDASDLFDAIIVDEPPRPVQVPVVKPPFYGIHRRLRVSTLCSGMLVDTKHRALDADGKLRPGESYTATVKVTGPAIITVTDRILHPDAGKAPADAAKPAAS